MKISFRSDKASFFLSKFHFQDYGKVTVRLSSTIKYNRIVWNRAIVCQVGSSNSRDYASYQTDSNTQNEMTCFYANIVFI